MGLIPEDPIKRCGVWFLSTDWVWSSLHKLGLTRHKKDPFIDVCAQDDNLTGSDYPNNNIASEEREEEWFDEAIDEVDKKVNHPRVAAFYKGVIHAVRKYFN